MYRLPPPANLWPANSQRKSAAHQKYKVNILQSHCDEQQSDKPQRALKWMDVEVGALPRSSTPTVPSKTCKTQKGKLWLRQGLACKVESANAEVLPFLFWREQCFQNDTCLVVSLPLSRISKSSLLWCKSSHFNQTNQTLKTWQRSCHIRTRDSTSDNSSFPFTNTYNVAFVKTGKYGADVWGKFGNPAARFAIMWGRRLPIEDCLLLSLFILSDRIWSQKKHLTGPYP